MQSKSSPLEAPYEACQRDVGSRDVGESHPHLNAMARFAMGMPPLPNQRTDVDQLKVDLLSIKEKIVELNSAVSSIEARIRDAEHQQGRRQTIDGMKAVGVWPKTYASDPKD